MPHYNVMICWADFGGNFTLLHVVDNSCDELDRAAPDRIPPLFSDSEHTWTSSSCLVSWGSNMLAWLWPLIWPGNKKDGDVLWWTCVPLLLPFSIHIIMTDKPKTNEHNIHIICENIQFVLICRWQLKKSWNKYYYYLQYTYTLAACSESHRDVRVIRIISL